MLKFNFSNKKTIIAIIVFLFVLTVAYGVFVKNGGSELSVAEIIRGDISQTVSETGQVQKEEKINLTFKNSGKVEKIFVSVGDKVIAGTQLMKLETDELYIKLQETKSGLAAARAKFEKLVAGPTEEEIKASRTKVSNKETLLTAAKQDLENEYGDGLTVLDDSYLKSYNGKNAVDYTRRTYFTSFDYEGLQVRDAKDRIEKAISLIKAQIDSARSNNTHENIDSALSKAREELSAVAGALALVRENCETSAYRNSVSSTDKSSLDTHRLNINTVLNDVVSSQQSIASGKLAVTEAEGNLQAAKDDLDLLVAPARPEDVDLYKAQVGEVEFQIGVLENQIKDGYLRSPVEARITDINKKIGEIVQPAAEEAAVVILPIIPYGVEVDIYEEDVIKIQVGNPADISLVAFPDKIFRGEVVSIDPAERMIEGVVYYKTIISFQEPPENLRPGMTADVVIKTENKENVLIMPEAAIRKKDGKEFVEILKNGKGEGREIKTGLLGDDGMVEILSGLEEGEKAILP